MTPNPKAPTRRPAWLGAWFLLISSMAPAALAERPPAPQLLPDTTVALLSVPNVPETARRFMSTAMGRMSQDPQLKPLVGHLYGSLVEAVAELQDQIGLSLPDLLAVPQGELALAVVAPEEGPLQAVLLLDTGDRVALARKLVERLTTRLEQSGTTRSEQNVAGVRCVIYDGIGPRRRQLAYFEKDATYVVGSDLKVLKGVLTFWKGGQGRTLADDPDFAAVMRRCAGGAGGAPQVTLYVDPIGIMRSVGQENTSVRVAVAVLPALGLDGLMAVGGSLILDDAQFDTVMHAHLLLDTPRAGVIKMIALRSGDSAPERWVPADVASYTTFHWNVEQTYKELAVLYDSFNGEGALAQRLQQALKPTGLDLEKEVLPAFDGRVTRITWVQRPVTLQSQASLMALKLKNTAVFDKAIDKLSSGAEARFERQTWAGKTYYQFRMPLPPDLPPERRPPQPCFGLLDDYLLVADREALYRQVVTTLVEGSQSLATDPEFKLISSKIRWQSGGASPALVSFSRPEESVRWLYELVNSTQTRERLAGQAENSRFFRTLDGALKHNPLPPFAVLRRYLAPGGAMVVDDPTGLHYMSFTLRRETD
jgi:hypothetical protein